MTVDVEDYFHVAAFADSIDRSQWEHLEYRAEANTHRLLELFAQTGIRATFFVLGWVAKRSPGLVKAIHAAGHEIASHGWSHKLVFNQTAEEFGREARDSKSLLEDLCATRVYGYRASTYSITRRSTWALDILCEAGFTYDSSIFPVRHDVYGIPDAPLAPGMMSTPGGRKIVEFPMSTVRMCGVKVPVSGGGYFRLLPYWLTRSGLSRINRDEKRPFVFYLHPWEIDPEQPRVAAGLLSRFRHYTNLTKTEARLRRLISQYRFDSMRSVLSGLGLPA